MASLAAALALAGAPMGQAWSTPARTPSPAAITQQPIAAAPNAAFRLAAAPADAGAPDARNRLPPATPPAPSTSPAAPLAKPPAPPPSAALLDALKAAPNAQAAAQIEARLQEAWHDQATPAVQLLMDQATESAHAGKLDDALADDEAAIVLQPDLPDLWRRRAETKFALGDDRGAFADLAQALSRDARLIPAWSDLSRFAELRKDNKRALAAWRKVLELDPKGEGAAKRLDRLQHLVNGEPI